MPKTKTKIKTQKKTITPVKNKTPSHYNDYVVRSWPTKRFVSSEKYYTTSRRLRFNERK